MVMFVTLIFKASSNNDNSLIQQLGGFFLMGEPLY